MKRIAGWIAVLAVFLAAGVAQAQQARPHEGETITVLLNNHPWAPVIREKAEEFTNRTGIKLRIEVFNESQFRTRLQTLMSARSSDLDVFVSLPSREGPLFAKAGWYADLRPFLADRRQTAADYDYEDFAPALRKAQTMDGIITGIPINIEGPVLWYRKDIFKKCGVQKPAYLEEIEAVASKLKACEPDIASWATRGRPMMVAYTLAGFIYNLGGDFKTAAGKPGLCEPNTIRAVQYYGGLLKSYGPVGAANMGFMETVEGLGQGRIAMGFDTSNPFSRIMKFPNRENDLGVMVLPKGKATGISRPVVLDWGASISAFSKHKEAAWQFIQWITSKEMQKHFFLAAQVAPSRTSVFKDPAIKAWADEKAVRAEWIAALNELAATGTSVLQSPTDRVPEAREAIGRAAQRVAFGEVDAKVSACEANKALESLQ